MAFQISIIEAKCRKDGLCADVCPARVFAWCKDEPPQVERSELCVLCGQCMAVCPHEAITHERLTFERFRKIEDAAPVSGEEMIAALEQRRSVRVYKNREVPRELLERIVAVAGYAPTSAHGGEGWARPVTVVSGEKAMAEVRALTVEYMRELEAMLSSAMVRFVARFKVEPRRGIGMLPDIRMRLAEHDAGRDMIIYQAPAAVFVHTPAITHEPSCDCDAALFSMMLAAHAFGLGSCWNGYLAKAGSAFKAKKATGLRRMLKIPEHHEVLAAMTLGYPGVKLHSVPHRESKVTFIGG